MSASDPGKLDRIVAEARRAAEKRERGYREQALKIYPWICGRCAREFTRANVRELTVHHRDHNHDNNPPDGSNWELLCLYCHDNEHQRQLEATRGGSQPFRRRPRVDLRSLRRSQGATSQEAAPEVKQTSASELGCSARLEATARVGRSPTANSGSAATSPRAVVLRCYRPEGAIRSQSSSSSSTAARPYGSLPTPVTVLTTWRFFRSMMYTMPLGTNGTDVTLGPPEITA